MEEEWKDIPGYEGLYQVSNLGRVYSYPKELFGVNAGIDKHNGKILNGCCNKKGYYQVGLSKEGKVETITVHKLVAMAFLGHKPDGMAIVVDHKDNNPLNNRLGNLQLITNRENASKDRVGSSEFTGVSWHKKSSKWFVKIKIDYKQIFLGYFIDEEEASEMYQSALSNIDRYFGNPKEFRDYLNSI